MTGVRETTRDRIRLLALDGPAGAGLDRELGAAVGAALARAGDDDAVDALVLHAALAPAAAAPGAGAGAMEDLCLAVLDFRKPSVVAVHGAPGLDELPLLMMFDWCVMSEASELRAPAPHQAAGCAFGAAVLGELLAWNLAREIVYGGRPVAPARLLQHGAVNAVVPEAELLEAALSVAAALANHPRQAFQGTKQVINDNLRDTLLRRARGHAGAPDGTPSTARRAAQAQGRPARPVVPVLTDFF